MILKLKDELNSCCPPCHSSLKLTAINSTSHDLFSRFKIHWDICYSSHCSWSSFLYFFSVQASSWGAEKVKIASCGCVLTCAGCPKGSSSRPLCFAYKSQHQKVLSFIKGWSNKCPNSGSSMLNIFFWCLTKLGHSPAVIILCHVSADSSGNVGTFFCVL